jgi:hypothetical protein
MESNATSGASLDLLHDIVIPPAVSALPPAPGWFVLMLLGLAFGIHVGMRYYAAYSKNLYRREALKELSVIKSSKEPDAQVKAILSLMKRVAMQCYGREKIASLGDTMWWEFVENHSKAKIDRQSRELAQKVLYTMDDNPKREEVDAFVNIAKVWIATHEGQQ